MRRLKVCLYMLQIWETPGIMLFIGRRNTVLATKEVILSAGVIGSPHILQHSGIGDSDLLTPLNVTTLIDLKTVGKNFQEQTLNTVGGPTNGFDLGGIGPKDGLAFPTLRHLFAEETDTSIAKIRVNLRAWAEKDAHNALSADALEAIYGVQAGLIVNDSG